MSSQDNNNQDNGNQTNEYGAQAYGSSSQESIPCAQVYVPPTASQEEKWWQESGWGEYLDQQREQSQRSISPLNLPWESQPEQSQGNSSWAYPSQPNITQYQSVQENNPWQEYQTQSDTPTQYVTQSTQQDEYTFSQMAYLAEQRLTDSQKRAFWGGGIDSSNDSINNGGNW